MDTKTTEGKRKMPYFYPAIVRELLEGINHKGRVGKEMLVPIGILLDMFVEEAIDRSVDIALGEGSKTVTSEHLKTIAFSLLLDF